MAIFSRGPHEYWLKPHFSKNEVAKSGLLEIAERYAIGSAESILSEVKSVFK